ncbi:MAG: tyrosine-type recombinase/integrase [Candidatus Limnocylindrales bacterium]
MPRDVVDLSLSDLMSEYVALFEGGWKPVTKRKYQDDFDRLLRWIASEGLPATTQALDFSTLLKFVGHLKMQPVTRGIWRGDGADTSRPRRESHARTLSLNSVNAYMRSIKSLCLWAHDDGVIGVNPFGRAYRRSKHHPLLPTEETPAKGAELDDLLALERGCVGSQPIDLRDQAMVSVLKTTGARNSSVRLLRLDDIDLERNLITMKRGKGNKTFDIVIQPETKAALIRYISRARKRLLPRYPVRGFESITCGPDEGWLFIASDSGYGSGQPLTVSGLSQMVNRRYHAGGGTLPRFGSHRIRHGVGTLLANNGMGVDEVSRYYAHSSTEVTKRYAQQTTGSLGEAAGEALRRAGLINDSGRRRAGPR